MTVGTVADETRCGIKKVREANTFTPNHYSVTMRFNVAEYHAFKTWFTYNLRKGAKSFLFPRIDDEQGVDVEYRFVPSSRLNVSNIGGQILEVTMEWEEV